MNSFEIRGGTPLIGSVKPQGAKNEALQVISAVLLTPDSVTINNIPDILEQWIVVLQYKALTECDHSFFISKNGISGWV